MRNSVYIKRILNAWNKGAVYGNTRVLLVSDLWVYPGVIGHGSPILSRWISIEIKNLELTFRR